MISAQDPSANLDQLEHVVLDHLIRMGQEELECNMANVNRSLRRYIVKAFHSMLM